MALMVYEYEKAWGVTSGHPLPLILVFKENLRKLITNLPQKNNIC